MTPELQVIFFDMRDTLGVVDRAGHLIPYRPTSAQLLETLRNPVGYRIGIITNLPDDMTSEQGWKMLADAGLAGYVERQAFVTNHDAGVAKPDPEIYRYAARRLGVEPKQCLFVGENLAEVLGASKAGMLGQQKAYPPGGDVRPKPALTQSDSPTFSGRVAELILEDEHAVGVRIVRCAATIAERLARQQQPPMRAMSMLVYLLHHFVDPFHHAKEEKVLLELAFAHGFPRRRAEWVFAEHDQGRLYFAALATALKRIEAGELAALDDFRICAEGFVQLYRKHGPREDNDLFPEVCRYLPADIDALAIDLMSRIGPGDPTPYYAIIAAMEAELQKGAISVADIHSIGVLGYEQCGEQDTLVPWEIFKSLAWVLKTQQDRALDVKLLAVDPGKTIKMQMGAEVIPEGFLSTGDMFDLLYVPGGIGSGKATQNSLILNTIQRHHRAGKVVATNCSGIAILHRAGILGNTPVTAAATVTRRLKAEGVQVAKPRPMWIGDREARIWTTTGGSGVHGSTVALISQYFGQDLGRTIGMMWDTYPCYGDDIFKERGPEYLEYTELEAKLQDDWEDILLPMAESIEIAQSEELERKR